ncbi:MAG: hypothetical protein FWH55_02510 [Oscillospiraceae bacterium]|nr:hypothetical protein [Oscillospiraceae bacterium]
MITRVVMPPLGETMDEGTIIKWLAHEGDSVVKGDNIIEVETDKVVIPVESFGSGILRKILVEEGATVSIGTLLAIIANADEDISAVQE